MHVITRRRLLEFSEKYPDATEPLNRWYRIVKHSEFKSVVSLQKTFHHADQVGKLTVFNIGGNKYRLITYIVYASKRIYIRDILSHRDYNSGKWKD